MGITQHKKEPKPLQPDTISGLSMSQKCWGSASRSQRSLDVFGPLCGREGRYGRWGESRGMEERGRDEKRRGGERMPGGGRRGGGWRPWHRLLTDNSTYGCCFVSEGNVGKQACWLAASCSFRWSKQQTQTKQTNSLSHVWSSHQKTR